MAAFKDGMLHAYATPTDAFAALDASLMDLDAALDENPLDLHDFIRGTRNFKPPLTKEQATYAFRGLDVNGDGSLEADEFIAGIDSGGFFRVSTSLPSTDTKAVRKAKDVPPLTISEFKSAMLKAYASAPDAFAALDATPENLDAALDQNPIDLKEFVRGTKTFKPPLTKKQAVYAFASLDADQDGELVSSEFAEGLGASRFDPPTTTTTHGTTSSSSATTATATTTPPTTRTSTSTSTTAPTTTTPPTTSSSVALVVPVGAATAAPLPQAGISGPPAATAVITMDEFKSRMLNAHASALKAFQALDANPAGLEDFIRGTKTFKPPLTEEQATYAFKGLDADHDNALPSFEFFEVLEFGRFFPTLRDLVVMGMPEVPTSTLGASRGSLRSSTTTLAPAGGGGGVDVAKVVLGVTVCPLLLLLVPCVRVLARRAGKDDRLETYKEVGPRSETSLRSDSQQREPTYTRKRSRFFGSGGMLSCCIRSTDETEEPPLLCTPCTTNGQTRLH